MGLGKQYLENMARIKQRNKIITLFIVLSVVTAFVYAGFESPKAAVQRKLKGFWNIEFENSFMNRDSIYEYFGVIIYIRKNDAIELPRVYMPGKSGKQHEELARKARGAWKVISTNPDSVFFNVPESPFHGKYAVRFFIDNKGWVSMNKRYYIFKMELKNDITLLICNKGGAMTDDDLKDWESKNE
ncbi:MAG: hypothetical protein LBL13_11195 [Bacteroidales bacterium]|jgi:hypothetical protein|nr:hypothetical protein [Bacteroidales bacterium]